MRLRRGIATLTAQEIEAAHLARFDLGPGYPQMHVPDYIRSLYRQHAANDLSLQFAPSWTPAKQSKLDDDLEAAVCGFVKIKPEQYVGLFPTFSGGVALDRALMAAINVSSTHRRDVVCTVTCTPCIDIMDLLLAEIREVKAGYAESNSNGGFGLNVSAVLERISSAGHQTERSGLVVILTSPENPTGEIWSAADLRLIGEACFDAGGVLIIDHAFICAGVHRRSEVPAAWEVLGRGSDWIAIWDTGKTFGLNEEKLGFVLAGSDRVARAVRDSLSVLQFDVARRQKLLFSELLRLAKHEEHEFLLRRACQRNFETTVSLALDSGVRVHRPDGGSLLLLELPDRLSDAESVRKEMLRLGVGVVSGNVFFHTRWRPHNLIRLALAREPQYFGDGLSAFFSHLDVSRDSADLV